MSDELKPLVNLGKRIEEQAKTVGLDFERFFIQPSLTGDVHTATAFFTLSKEQPETPAEHGESDPEFDQLVQDAVRAEQEQKAIDARKRLEEMDRTLSDPSKGLGLDDPD